MQATCLVVDTRAAAEEVLRAYEARRAGIVTCKIAAEHTKDRCKKRLVALLLPVAFCQPVSDIGMRKHSYMPLPATAGLEALVAHVKVAENATGAQCIFDTMLGSWLMARDRTCVPPLVSSKASRHCVKNHVRSLMSVLLPCRRC